MLREAGIVVERREPLEADAGAVHHGGGDGLAEPHHRALRDLHEHAIEGEDLRPVGGVRARGLVVHGRDGGLDLIRTDNSARQRRAHEGHALLDLGSIPERAILLIERDELPVRSRSRGAPRIGEQHQRQEAAHLRHVGERAPEEPREADGFVREVAPNEIAPVARCVALVEDEVEHVHHRLEALAALALAR